MTLTPRQVAVRSGFSKTQTSGDVAYTKDVITETYGSLVFGDAAQRKHLPRDVYKRLRRTISQGEVLDPSIADAVANGMKDWAVAHGATHYSHWFQPMTGATAEKQDSFIAPTGDGTAVLEFLDPIEPGLDKETFMARLEEQIETSSIDLLPDDFELPKYRALEYDKETDSGIPIIPEDAEVDAAE